MTSRFRRLTERQIQKALAEGKLSKLKGEGRPLPPRTEDAYVDPGEAVGYRIMAEHGALPEEIELKAQLEEAQAVYRAAETAEEKHAAMKRIAEIEQKYNIAREARQRFMRG